MRFSLRIPCRNRAWGIGVEEREGKHVRSALVGVWGGLEVETLLSISVAN